VIDRAEVAMCSSGRSPRRSTNHAPAASTTNNPIAASPSIRTRRRRDASSSSIGTATTTVLPSPWSEGETETLHRPDPSVVPVVRSFVSSYAEAPSGSAGPLVESHGWIVASTVPSGSRSSAYVPDGTTGRPPGGLPGGGPP
jgi:hypothetical protein